MTVPVAVPIVLACAALVAPPALAQGDRWERQVRHQLDRAAGSLGSRGTGKVLATHAGMLDTEQSESFTVNLNAGTSYIVVGACDEDCWNLGLVLSDLTSHDLAADRAGDNAPVVRVTPRETASYRVKAVMERCRMNPCRYGVAVLTLPPP